MATTILGLVGKKQSGKDTFAARLVQEHGFTRLAFADPLKSVALGLNPLIDVHHEGTTRHVPLRDLIDLFGWDRAKEEVPAVRILLQRLGVSVRDYVGEHAWVQALAQKASLVGGPVVVTDCRFPNELQWVRAMGGESIRIVRPGQNNHDQHDSETALDAWVTDHLVHNDSTIESLHTTADFLVEYIEVAPVYMRSVAV